MASVKEIRFAKLVEESGQPEIVVLWADPKKDRDFMNHVEKGQIVTVIQKPTGNKKDFGLIGFHPQPFAVYLKFPKPLKGHEDAVIIGIKYDLLKTPVGHAREESPRVSKPEPAPPKPKRKPFHLTIRRQGTREIELTVQAFDSEDAKTLALVEVSSQKLTLSGEETENSIISATEV